MIWMDTDMLGRFAASVVYIAREEKTRAEQSRARQSTTDNREEEESGSEV
jgi:hypothetical protein